MAEIEAYIDELLNEGPLTVEETGVLVGSNYFSGGPVIRIRVNLGAYNEVFTNLIPGFLEELKRRVPTLEEHFCSLGVKGGFFKRVEEGTLLGHVMEHTAIEMQNMAGMDIAFGKTRETKVPGVYNVVFRFMDEVAGTLAGKGAAALLNALLLKKDFPVNELVEKLVEIRETRLLGFSTRAIVEEAAERGIPCIRLDKYNLVQLGSGKFRKNIRATITENTSVIAVETADNKYTTSQILSDAGVPVPRQIKILRSRDALLFFKHHRKPMAVKPLEGRRGMGVTMGVADAKALVRAFRHAAAVDKEVIVQEQNEGNVYRILVIDHKFCAAVMLTPAFITGNGKDSIATLTAEMNRKRISDVNSNLYPVEFDKDTLHILAMQQMTPETILPAGIKVQLKNTGNIRLGSSATDVTDKVNTYNRFVCERITRVMNLDVAGIDIISPDISLPLDSNDAVVIDVNAAPDFRVHIRPHTGIPRLVQKNFVDMLFQKGSPSRIPLISVTGSHGKSLFTQIIEKYYSGKGIYAGALRTDGLYINKNRIKTIDLLNASNTSLILKDPTIEAAVTETPVETILNFGLGYEMADIGVVLNLEEKPEYYTYDHIRDLEDVAYAKSVVAEEVHPDGYAVLNASNPLILEITERLYCKPAFFSPKRPEGNLRRLADDGRPFTWFEGPMMILSHHRDQMEICRREEIVFPCTEGSHDCESVLAAALTMHLLGERKEMIRKILCDL